MYYYAHHTELQCDPLDASMGELWLCATPPIPAGVHAVAGAVSGSLAAVLTHPVDVLKTRRQMGEGTRRALDCEVGLEHRGIRGVHAWHGW